MRLNKIIVQNDLALMKQHNDQVSKNLSKITELVKHEYRVNRLDYYKYNEMIQYITIMGLQVDEVKQLLQKQLDLQKGMLIDVKV